MVMRKIQSSKDAHALLSEAHLRRLYAENASFIEQRTYLTQAETMEKAALDYLKLPEPPEYGTGGEMVPQGEAAAKYPGIDYLVREPDITAANASVERIRLSETADCFDIANDAAESIHAKDSLERMLTHQMSAAHVASMKLFGRVRDELDQAKQWRGRSETQARVLDNLAKLSNAAARLMGAYQQGMSTLDKRRNGGKQTVQVIHQHVDARGGQVAVAGNVARRGEGDDGRK